MDWQPSATLRALQMRAAVLGRIRSFFAERDVLEVETPALSAAAVTDLQLESFQIQVGDTGSAMYLQTSPEFRDEAAARCRLRRHLPDLARHSGWARWVGFTIPSSPCSSGTGRVSTISR